MKKLACLVMFGLVLFVGCSSNKNTNSLNKDELIVGMELQFPPFETIDKEGKPYGISVDFANDLGEFIGKKVKIEEIAYSGLIPALTSGKIDMIISSMTITDSRKEQIDFSNPYANVYLALLIYSNSTVQGPNDLNNENVSIAVKKGTSGQILAESNFPKAKLLVFDKESEAVLEVSQGKADCFIYDVYSVYKSNQEYPNTTRTYLGPISEKDSGNWGVGIRKNDTELKEKINAFINDYSQTGKRDEIINKHLKEVKQVFDEQNIPFFLI